MRLEDVEMDAAATGAAHGLVLASGATANHTEHREIAVAFSAIGHHNAGIDPRPWRVFSFDD
ncbi:hypothetical protein AC629_34450 [Bradyrhizobium sp. NAS80.1]|nr:hypothetical protein AC629_34450 [Bradyrhizobium sp. NAS80.1]